MSEFKDAAGALIPIYDPLTTRPDDQGAGSFETLSQGTSRKIESALYQRRYGYVPGPQFSGFFNNHLTVGRFKTDRFDLTTKIDHQFTSSHKISGTFSIRRPESLNQDGLPQPVGSELEQLLNQTNMRIAHDWVMSPIMANHLTVGFNRANGVL